mmetsp:Transcript_17034/g.30399  ORF Transcript_17034/g.30399 Transcript_17034/m.30399 type:complete len:206 (-) Transcript_17034:46-663(-)
MRVVTLYFLAWSMLMVPWVQSISHKPNAVIGGAMGLPDDRMIAFLASANTFFAPSTHIVLIDNETRPLYDEFHVRPFYSNSSMLQFGYGKLPKVVLRFWHVCDFLKSHGNEYGYVLHLDTSDIVFQADPFEAAQPFLSRYGGVLLHHEQGTVDMSWGNSYNFQVIKQMLRNPHCSEGKEKGSYLWMLSNGYCRRSAGFRLPFDTN